MTCDHDFPIRDGRCVGCHAGVEGDGLSLDRLVRAATAVLRMYPASVFTGSSGDPGPRRIVALREAVRKAKGQRNPKKSYTEAERRAAVARVDRGEDIDWNPVP